MFIAKRYHPDCKETWDAFISGSQNPAFIYYRDFIGYHGNKIKDHSLLIYKENKLIALLPACEDAEGSTLTMHRGLPFADIILNKNRSWAILSHIIPCLLDYARVTKFSAIRFTLCPTVYKVIPAEGTEYYLRDHGFVLSSQKLSSVIRMDTVLKQRINKSRLTGLQDDLEITFDNRDISSFYPFLKNTLREKYNAEPIHSMEDLKYLIGQFGNNIIPVIARLNDQIVGLMLLFVYQDVIKTQYIATSVSDVSYSMIRGIVDKFASSHTFLDLGTSNSLEGNNINYGNLTFKINNGGLPMCVNTYMCTL